ncbi:glycosyltransferase family 4 protein [Hymenobacter nivis]|uniref:Glycosyltransferase n=1 Tax=Hymenobacter nivis TaxID=1850093 RepID=A0A502HFC1_9BACT|nr:glycosyltransferase family 4 protein [Hymenobacter nivis]TPG72263.1 glycosyltransferase [Hymenobacter nivis]
MKKIIFVSHEATLTGAPILLLNIIRCLRGELREDFIVVLGKDGPLRPQFEELAHVVVAPSLLASGRFANNLRRLRLLNSYNNRRRKNALSFENVKVIFSNTIVNGKLVEEILSFNKARVITYVHELAYTIQTFNSAEINKALQQTSLFLAGSNAVLQNLLSLGVANDLVHVVPSSIPVAAITEKLAITDVDSIRASLCLQPHEQLIVAVGTADWRKGNDLFIQMAARLVQMQPQLHFAWVGVSAGTLEHLRMRYEIEHYHLDGRVHLVAVTPDYLNYIAAAELFVLTSREDPFPLVVLEAAAAGKPIVCFADSGGTPGFVGVKNGTVVPYGDVIALSDAIEALLQDSSMRYRKGEHARITVQSEYDTPQVAVRIARLIALEHA